MAYKPAIPKGTRDFSPEVLHRRNLIFDTIREVYERYGYMPIETPSMELLETLTGKYGDEGDKLLFRILNSGNYLEDIDDQLLLNKKINQITPRIAEKGLRYDLTVPFARYVVQHRNEITFPFKRYQIQPVWRADRPQKGRYREFYQCDADVIGSDSLLNEFELVQIIDRVFSQLNIKVNIRLNNRKILMGIAEAAGMSHAFFAFTIALDKMDKAGIPSVMKELTVMGMKREVAGHLEEIFRFAGSDEEKLSRIGAYLSGSVTGMKGIEEMRELLALLQATGTTHPVIADITLARGLNYYTGTIFEVTAKDTVMGSLCGGGRYDDLTGIFGLPGVSGVGISFGADRIYDVMKELKLFPLTDQQTTRVLFINFGGEDTLYSLKALAKIRSQKIRAEIYPDTAKIKKQMAYADARNIPFVILAGESERSQGKYTLKTMESGEQQIFSLEEIMHLIR